MLGENRSMIILVALLAILFVISPVAAVFAADNSVPLDYTLKGKVIASDCSRSYGTASHITGNSACIA